MTDPLALVAFSAIAVVVTAVGLAVTPYVTVRLFWFGVTVVVALLDAVDALRSWLSPTCDVPGCDADPEPLFIDGGMGLLCPEHLVDYLVARFDAESDDDAEGESA